MIERYRDTQGQVEWHGLHWEDEDAFDAFLVGGVADRLNDADGSDDFETHVRALASTGFARESFDALAAAAIPEERDWAIGEAIAEAHLQETRDVTWPWNMERDKRTPRASLPGADLVGFQSRDGEVRLALGEVKTSSDPNAPPNVMNGRGGMTHQLEALASDLALIGQLLKWLQPRCKGTEHQLSFDSAVSLLLSSGNRALVLFGVLIRDTAPDERDLRSRARRLAVSLQDPTSCHLVALYLPCQIADLPARLPGGRP